MEEIQLSDIGAVTTVMLEDSLSTITVGMSSVIGRRKEQQDTIESDDDYAIMENGKFIAVLCDGMGGLSGGKQASKLCATHIKESFHADDCEEDISQFYRRVIVESDRKVTELKDKKGQSLGAGSTMVSVVIKDGELHWASVGDSHIYLIRGEQIRCITRDHNYFMLLEEKVKRGELTQQEAENHPQREALVSYMGMGGVKYVDHNAVPFKLIEGDYIVLCSDGLYRTISDEDIKNIARGIGEAKDVAKGLTEYAMRAGKKNQDNTSVIVIQYKG